MTQQQYIIGRFLDYTHPKLRDYINNVVATAEAILRENRLLQKELNKLTEQLRVYKIRLLSDSKSKPKNSQNSDQPSSWDHFEKMPRTQSQREFLGRKVGGQKGHQGSTLNPVVKPHIIRKHPLSKCPDCQGSLKNSPVVGIEKRQVFDLILPQLQVTEHQSEKKFCQHCQAKKNSPFPAKNSSSFKRVTIVSNGPEP